MKKSLRFTAAGLSICMMAAMLAGCSSSSSTDTTAAADASEAAADTQEAEAKTSDLSFAFCTNTLNNTFQSSIDAKLSELCKENGISYTCLDPDYDLNKQLSQLSDCANSGYDAVFVIPVDSAGITSGLAEIADAGIPIFNVDTAVIDDDIEQFVTQFVGTNAYMAGQLVGEQMTKDYPDGAKIAVLDFRWDWLRISSQQTRIWKHSSVSMTRLPWVRQQLSRQQTRPARSVYIASMHPRMENRHS